MSESKKRKYYGPEFKAKAGLEAVRGVRTINEISQEYGVQQRPDTVYQSASGGGAMIVDKFGGAGEKQEQQPEQKQNRGNAVQLRVKLNVQLKLTEVLS